MPLRVAFLYAVAVGFVAGSMFGCGGGVPNPNPTPLPAIWPNQTQFAAQDHDHPHLHNGTCVVNTKLLTLIAASGARIARFDNAFVPWETPHRKDGSYDFDCVIEEEVDAVKVGLTPLFTEANPRKDHASDDEAAIPPYLQAAAPNMGWVMLELGNEPDDAMDYWPSTMTPEQYWALVKPWAESWRAGWIGDHVSVSTGGTQSVNLAWQSALAAAIKNDGDFANGDITAMGVHLYGESLRPNAGVSGQTLLAKLGTDLVSLKAVTPVPVWVTEFGVDAWSSTDLIGTPPGVAPYLQSQAGWLDSIDGFQVPVFSIYQAQDNCAHGYEIDAKCYWSATPGPTETPHPPTTDGLIPIDGAAAGSATPKPAYFTVQRYLGGH